MGLPVTYRIDSVIKRLLPRLGSTGTSQLAKAITKYILPSTPQLPVRRKAAPLQHRNTPQFSYLSSLFSNLFKSLGAGLAHLATKCMCVRACVCVLPVKRGEKTHRFEFVQCLPLFPAGMGFESQETKSMASTSSI